MASPVRAKTDGIGMGVSRLATVFGSGQTGGRGVPCGRLFGAGPCLVQCGKDVSR